MILLILVQNQVIAQKFNQNFEKLGINQKTMADSGIIQYTNLEPLAIFNDSAFGPTGYDFPGIGTPDDPYLIDSYNITDSTADAIWIENTTKYFKISNCFLDSEYANFYGIYLVNVTQGMFKSNIIINSGENGVGIIESDKITALDNIIHDVGVGIDIWKTNNSIFSHNTIYNCPYSGINLINSHNNTLLLNNIHDCDYEGIYMDLSNNNTLKDNTIYDIYSERGIYSSTSHFNNFSGNTIYNCSFDNIYLYFSHNNSFLYNTIYESPYRGLALFSSNNNTIFWNNIYNNTNYGLQFNGTADSNFVKWNNFVRNNFIDGSQAFDDTTDKYNVITNNYWDDWSGTGNYSIAGAANNNDSSPMMSPVLPTVRIISPLTQEYGTDTIIVALTGHPTIKEYWYYIAPLDSQNQTWNVDEERLLPDGSYTLHAYGKDTLGNIGYMAISFTIETSTTTTITSATSTTSDETTTTSKAGVFPGFIPVLLFFVVLVVIDQRRKNL
jgi:parallel beta-helix repeat protein